MTLTAYSLSNITGTNVVIGTGVADATGHWSITSIPLVDGTYGVGVSAVGAYGASAASTSIRTIPLDINDPYSYLYGNQNTLQIDTIGPNLSSFQVSNAKQGTFQVGFSSATGLIIPPLVTTSNYAVAGPVSAALKGRNIPVTTLTGPDASAVGGTLRAQFYLVTGTLGGGKAALGRNGTYVFTVHAAGIVSISGAVLDGEYAGHLPSGNGHPGGDFQIKVTIRNGKQVGLAAIKPIKTTPHVVKARVASRHQA